MNLKIGQNSKVKIKWNVLPIDYTEESENKIRSVASEKYGISKDKIYIEPNFITTTNDGVIDAFANTNAQDIQSPDFQVELFKKYIEERGIEDYDFDKIVEIDSIINNNIDYEVYDKHKKYTLKWIKWSNFMSYGEDNFFDFTSLKGLVLLTSEPANQGGKSTFCLDLFRFLLFGKVTSRENDWTLSRVFNDFNPKCTEVNVEGCIIIDGVEYVIQRKITRPALNKRTDKSKVTQKVNYYRIVNNDYVSLEDEENEDGMTNTETNKIIKEAIGNEKDFDLMICVNSDNLKGLISLKDTDRGRLISRWIGLLPLEEKDKLAREYYNKTLVPSLLSNKYSETDLKESIVILEDEVKDFEKLLKELKAKKKESENKLSEFNETKEKLLQSKTQIDETLTKVDITTIENQIKAIVEQGTKKRAEKKVNEDKLKEIGDIDFNEAEYKEISEKLSEMNITIGTCRERAKWISQEIKTLEKSEYCPTCGAKLKDVDNTDKIETKQEEYNGIVEKGKKLVEEVKTLEGKKNKLEETRELYNQKLRVQLTIDKIDVDIENLLSKHKEKKRIIKDVNDNREAIERNNKIDTALNTINVNISNENSYLNRVNGEIVSTEKNIEHNKKTISDQNKIIKVLQEESVLLRNWKLYLDMIGKNGISKLVLRNTLPLINGELKRLLSDVCDFYVQIEINDKNDVEFYKIHDNVKAKLGSGSGLEQTVASLALRSVLSKISTFSKPSFVVFDEILGGVADENYDKVKLLYDKIVNDYDFIFQISHLKAIADWHNKTVVVKKVNNISSIGMLQ